MAALLKSAESKDFVGSNPTLSATPTRARRRPPDGHRLSPTSTPLRPCRTAATVCPPVRRPWVPPGSTCVNASPAVRSAAATRARTRTPRCITRPPVIRSSAPSCRDRTGCGATSDDLHVPRGRRRCLGPGGRHSSTPGFGSSDSIWRAAARLVSVDADMMVGDGFPLGAWLATYRDRGRRDDLRTDERAALELVPGWIW